MRDWKMEHQKCMAGKCEKNKLGATCVVNVVTKIKYASKATTACKKHVKLFR